MDIWVENRNVNIGYYDTEEEAKKVFIHHKSYFYHLTTLDIFHTLYTVDFFHGKLDYSIYHTREPKRAFSEFDKNG